MTTMTRNFVDPERVRQYLENGPPAFAPGHAGLMQMIGVLLAEHVPADGTVLVIGAGGGLETRHLAAVEPGWHFTGVDPAPAMLDLARATLGDLAGDRVTLLEGTVTDAPDGPFDAATCILVLGLVADDGSKLTLLEEAHRRLTPGAPFVLVDQCLDRAAPDFERRLARYGAYARRSGVPDDLVTGAIDALRTMPTVVPPARDEALLAEAGFTGTEQFYQGMAWRGWIAFA